MFRLSDIHESLDETACTTDFGVTLFSLFTNAYMYILHLPTSSKVSSMCANHARLHIFTQKTIMGFLSYVPVNGIELGLHLYKQKDSSASVNIEKSGDSEDMKRVKSFLSIMIAKDPVARPSIQVVVDNLNYLLTSLRAQQLDMPDFFRGKNYIYNYPCIMADLLFLIMIFFMLKKPL